jgi:5-methylcytosine-specific restriction endonuclease McrA
MKFELRPLGKQYSDSELLDDIKRIALLLNKSTLNQREYKRYGGKHGTNTFLDRFGGWVEALSRAGLKHSQRSMPTTEEELITELRRISQELGKNSMTSEEYERFGKYSRGPFLRVFGTWTNAIKKAGLALSDNYQPPLTNEKLFQNLERIWIALGRQPTYNDIERPLSDHSVTTYERRFGSWRGSLEAFITYVNEPVADSSEESNSTNTTIIPAVQEVQSSVPRKKEQRTPRAPNSRLTFVVMKRDNFTCRACGRSPANQLGLILHVDHIVPWAGGGETVLENLQTLCERCNLGKGDLN